MTFKNLVVTLVSWIMIAALIVVVAVIIIEFNNMDSVFRVSNYKALAVSSGSMNPRIEQGSLVLIHKVPVRGLAAGDIITFRQSGLGHSLVTHRIYGVIKKPGMDRGFATKGDANTWRDNEVVKASSVEGQVEAVIPWVGYLVQTVKSEIGYFLLILIPGLVVIANELSDIFKRIRKVRA